MGRWRYTVKLVNALTPRKDASEQRRAVADSNLGIEMLEIFTHRGFGIIFYGEPIAECETTGALDVMISVQDGYSVLASFDALVHHISIPCAGYLALYRKISNALSPVEDASEQRRTVTDPDLGIEMLEIFTHRRFGDDKARRDFFFR